MNGIRFYRASITHDTNNELTSFYHGRINNDTSDFDYIFKPIYSHWKGLYVLNDELPFPKDEIEYDGEKTFSEHLVWTTAESHYCCKSTIFKEFGMYVSEFEGNTFLILKKPPSVLTWGAYITYEAKHPKNIECIIHNWDGIYWEIFSKNERTLQSLIQFHKSGQNLDLYHVCLSKDYPTPSRPRNKLTPV